MVRNQHWLDALVLLGANLLGAITAVKTSWLDIVVVVCFWKLWEGPGLGCIPATFCKVSHLNFSAVVDCRMLCWSIVGKGHHGKKLYCLIGCVCATLHTCTVFQLCAIVPIFLFFCLFYSPLIVSGHVLIFLACCRWCCPLSLVLKLGTLVMLHVSRRGYSLSFFFWNNMDFDVADQIFWHGTRCGVQLIRYSLSRGISRIYWVVYIRAMTTN